jgi:hypothetical protein
MSVFRKNNKIYIVHKEDLENYEHFIERGNFIASQLPKTEEEYNEVVLYSRMYINNKYLGCEYNQSIMHKLQEMVNKC